ncbi:hypothetical protein SAMN04487948_10984 [Halogranum amylolyticum]|uniref:Uncharacterized protein n=1 Tax=Halogranum amylolyticum TaxID=660520 RepID=A0A1H8U1Y1_9EURY|nr:hypothetical protein [Halogranum amylolyticum]SEO97280.1 hypothetical protein SAMN04487948_10984 [Halogranum amylolyticum]
MRCVTAARNSKNVGTEGGDMAAVKRTLFRFRRGSDDEKEYESDAAATVVVDAPTDVAERSFDEGGGTDEADETDDGPGRPTAWIGLAVASLGGFAAAVYKILQHRKAAKEAAKEEPWRVEEESSRLPDDAGTASLVGFVFLAVVNAVGKRFERDPWAEE